MSPSPPPPPPPGFVDVPFFDSPQNHLFPSPLHVPSSADLFSPSETTDFLGFLDNFDYNWDFEAPEVDGFGHGGSYHDDGMEDVQMQPAGLQTYHHPPPDHRPPPPPAPEPRPPDVRANTAQSTSPSVSPPEDASADSNALMRLKPALTTPQKRQNHILSEQKRRNAIRDGYFQLTELLAPAGAAPGSGMPTRGRPKGSGSRGRGSKSKSVILFRAREYIQFLEEGRDALLQEVLKVEAAAGIRY